MSLFGRESQVEKHSKMHVELVYQCVQELKEVMDCFYRNEFDGMEEKVRKVSETEHKADIIRRQMEIEFYKGAFLPFDREDKIILAELVDGVADMTQATAYGICLSRVQFPEKLEGDFREFVSAICNAVNVLKDCVESLDLDLGSAISKAHEVEEMEDGTDKMERKITRKLYQSYRDKEFGILTLIDLKNTVKKLGNIVDRAEDASDRVLIIAAKKRG
jgi:uncharacterized protein